MSFKTTLTATPLLCTGRMLDTVPTAGRPIALSFSVRKTSSSYKGPAMRVRRASDGRETDIGFLQTELNLASLLSFCNGFDAFVSVWYDQSGNGRHAVQDTWALQPQVVARGKVITDSAGRQITLRFNGGYLVTPWEPQAAEMQYGAGLQIAASSGVVTYVGDLAQAGPQSGLVKTYTRTLGVGVNAEVFTDFPNPELPTGHDKLLLEGYLVGGAAGNMLVYPESAPDNRFRRVAFGGPDGTMATKTTLNNSVVGGPSTLSVKTVTPQLFNTLPTTRTTLNWSIRPTLYWGNGDVNNDLMIAAQTTAKTLTMSKGHLAEQYFMVEYTLPSLTAGVPFSVSLEYLNPGPSGTRQTGTGFSIQTFFTNPGALGTGVAKVLETTLAGYRLGFNLAESKVDLLYSFAGGDAGTLDTEDNALNSLPFNRWWRVDLGFDGERFWSYSVRDAVTGEVWLERATIQDTKAVGRMRSAAYGDRVRVLGATGRVNADGGTGQQQIRNVLITVPGGYSGPLLPKFASEQYLRGVAATNGRIYALPYNASHILDIDHRRTSTDADVPDDMVRSKAVGRPVAEDLGSEIAGKWKALVRVGNTGYMVGVPYNANKVVVIDTTAGEGTDPVITYLPSEGTGFIASQGNWVDGVVVPEGNPNAGLVYCVPYNASQVLEVNPAAGTYRLLGITVGGQEFQMTGAQKFSAGAWTRGKVVCCGDLAATVLVIDTNLEVPVATLQGSTGSCVVVRNVGRGYTYTPGGPGVAVTVPAPVTGGTAAGGLGQVTPTRIVTGVTLVAQIFGGASVTGGSGYSSAPVVRFGASSPFGGPLAFPAGTALMAPDLTYPGGQKVVGVDITHGGDGITSGITVSFSGGKGSDASARTLVAGGGVVLITLNDGGSGYLDPASIVVEISGGGGSGAAATAVVSGGKIVSVDITNAGSGYNNLKPPSVRFSGGKGATCVGTVTATIDGKVTGISLPDGPARGGGYVPETFTYEQWQASSAVQAAARVVIQAPGETSPKGNPQGIRAVARIEAVDPTGQILSFKMLNTGSGYVSAPSVTIGAPQTEGNPAGTATASFSQDGCITSVTMESAGSRYTAPGVVGVAIRDGSEEDLLKTITPGSAGAFVHYLEGSTSAPGYKYALSSAQIQNDRQKFVSAHVGPDGSSVFCLPYNSHRVLRIDVPTGALAPVSLEEVTLLAGAAAGSDLGTRGGKFNGGVAGPGGLKLYALPRTYGRVLLVDMSLAGQMQLLARQFNGSWSSGVLSEWNKVIYALPSTSTSLLIIDTKDESRSETKTFDNVSGTGSKWSSTVLADSGLIYGIPSDIPDVLELNPGVPLREKSLPAAGVVLADRKTIVFAPAKGFFSVYNSETDVMNTVQLPEALRNVSYSDGVLCSNGTVVFAPTFNVTDPFPFTGNVGLYTPSDTPDIPDTRPTLGFSHGPAVAGLQYSTPYPSRSCVAFGDVVAWVPRGSSGDDATRAAMVLYDAASPDVAPAANNSTGAPGTSRVEPTVEWASACALTGAVKRALVTQPGVTTTALYQTSTRSLAVTEGVVIPSGAILLVPARPTTSIQIIWPSNLNLVFGTFPANGVARPTAVAIPSGMLTRTSDGVGSTTSVPYKGLFGGAVLASDDRVYCVPHNHPRILAIDTASWTVEEIGDFSTYAVAFGKALPSSLSDSEPRLWSGAVTGRNGKIYCVPSCADHVLVIDPLDPNPLTRLAFLPGQISGAEGMAGKATMDKWSGGVMGRNGKIYCVPFAASAVLVIDTNTDTWNVPAQGPLTGFLGSRRWLGGVLAPSGKIFCAPWDSDEMLVIEPEIDGSYTLSLSAVNAGAGDSKWSAGALAPNGLIYFAPGTVSTVLQVDPETGVMAQLSGAGGDFQQFHHAGFVTAPNGKLYGMPQQEGTQLPGLLELSPARKYVGIFNFSDGGFSGTWTEGATVKPEYRLRPHVLDDTTVMFHNGGGAYALYPGASATADTRTVSGPPLADGVSVVTTVDSVPGTLLSVIGNSVSTVVSGYGGVAGVKSFSGTADLYAMVNDSSLDAAVGNTVAQSRFIFDTIYAKGALGVYGALASNTAIATSVRDLALSTFDSGYQGDVGSGATVSVGLVKGMRYDDIGAGEQAPEFTTVLNGDISEAIIFSSDQTARIQTLGENQSFYFLDTQNPSLTAVNSTNSVSVVV